MTSAAPLGLPGRFVIAVLTALEALLRALGPERASNLGGAIARVLGPMLPVSRVAHDNLARAFPEIGEAERRRIVRAVWDNMGRTIAEMPTLDQLRVTSGGPGYALAIHPAAQVEMSAGRAIFFSAHLANWEMTVVAGGTFVADFGVVYRAPQNRAVDVWLRRLRARYGGKTLHQFPKGPAGARQAVAHLRAGHLLGLLADQKTNDGIAAPFFGRDAMTTAAMASLAMKFGRTLLPVRLVRLGPARFRVEVEAPLPAPATGDRHTDIKALTFAVNATIERWVRAEPGQWLWLHRRWPKAPALP